MACVHVRLCACMLGSSGIEVRTRIATGHRLVDVRFSSRQPTVYYTLEVMGPKDDADATRPCVRRR